MVKRLSLSLLTYPKLIMTIMIIIIISRTSTASAYYGNVDAPSHQSPESTPLVLDDNLSKRRKL